MLDTMLIDPENRLATVWKLAKQVYGDEDAVAFMENAQPACMGFKISDPDALISVEELVLESLDGYERAAGYLASRLENER